MSVITITLTDEGDRDDGVYSTQLKVEGSNFDDGFITAAHLVGIFLTQFVKTPEFQTLITPFAEEVCANPALVIDAGIGQIEAA